VIAAIVRAIDQDAADARGAHPAEGDLLLAREGGHPMIPPIDRQGKPLELGLFSA